MNNMRLLELASRRRHRDNANKGLTSPVSEQSKTPVKSALFPVDGVKNADLTSTQNKDLQPENYTSLPGDEVYAGYLNDRPN